MAIDIKKGIELELQAGTRGLQGFKGDKGDPGNSFTPMIGNVETLNPGDSATASTSIDPEQDIVYFNFGIPKGDKGDTGDTNLTTFDIVDGELKAYDDKGVIYNLGTVAMEPRGEYDAETYYKKLNTVLYNDSTYMAKEDVVGETPSTSSKWQLIGGGLQKEDIVDNLDSNDATKMLSAKQGKVLNEGKPQVFDTVALMKAANLKNGMVAETLGYYSVNDGGHATYKINSSYSESDYYEELDNGLYAVLNEKTNVNTMMFGIKNDESEDISSKLQIAIDYVSNKTTDKILTFINGSYVMENSVIIPYGIDMHGSYSTIKSKINNGYMFGLNTNQAMTDWVVSYGWKQMVIKDFYITRYDNTITTGGVFVIGCPINMKNISILKMYNSIKQVAEYIDNKTLENVYVMEGLGNYDCSLYLGDGLNIDQCGEIRFVISQAAGATIKNCINLGLELTSCKGVTITGLHNEHVREIIFKGSNVTMENCYLTRRPSLNCVIDVKNQDHSVSSILLKNIMIVYYASDNFDKDTIYSDVNIENGSDVSFEIVYRASNYFDGGYDENTTQIYINSNLVNPLYRKYSFLNKIIVPEEQTKSLYETEYTFFQINKSTRENYGKYSSSDGTLYFTAVPYLDTTRLIKSQQSNRDIVNKTITDDNTYLKLITDRRQMIPNSIIRFYRGAASGVYDYICDVPVFNGSTLYFDNKETIGNVAKWEAIGSHTFNSGIVAYNLETNGTNVKIKAASIPTVGTWTKGDVIINSSPSAGGTYGWICTTSGTPGTWKSLGNIEA